MGTANISLNTVRNSGSYGKSFKADKLPFSVDTKRNSSALSPSQLDLINRKHETAKTDSKKTPELSKINDAVTKVNEQIQYVQKSLHFRVHEGTGQFQVEVIDMKTQKVIKEIPPEKLLDSMGKIHEAIGALIDKEG